MMKLRLKKMIQTLPLFFVVAALLPSTVVNATSKDTIGKELTTLYRSARAVISKNQGLINDASKGDKGLSPANVAKLAIDNYQKAVGKTLGADNTSAAEKAMLDAVKSVMGEAQSLINEKGVGFKGFLPAIFARQVARQFTTNMSGKMSIKLTAPKAYVRNRSNRPDKWEANVIETIFKDAAYEVGKPHAEKADYKGKAAYRYILPEYYKESCLGCHGSPKGDLDITGGKKEGGVLGELGGAISLVIFD